MEDNFYSYFMSLNKILGEQLRQLSACDNLRLTSNDISNMGLHTTDSNFINELLDIFNLDIRVGCNICDCMPGWTAVCDSPLQTYLLNYWIFIVHREWYSHNISTNTLTCATAATSNNTSTSINTITCATAATSNNTSTSTNTSSNNTLTCSTAATSTNTYSTNTFTSNNTVSTLTSIFY